MHDTPAGLLSSLQHHLLLAHLAKIEACTEAEFTPALHTHATSDLTSLYVNSQLTSEWEYLW